AAGYGLGRSIGGLDRNARCQPANHLKPPESTLFKIGLASEPDPGLRRKPQVTIGSRVGLAEGFGKNTPHRKRDRRAPPLEQYLPAYYTSICAKSASPTTVAQHDDWLALEDRLVVVTE